MEVSDAAPPAVRSPRRGVTRFGRRAGFALLCCLFAAVAVAAFGSWTYHWRGLDVRLGVRPSWRGETRLLLPPLGEVRARTHATPVALIAELRALSFEEIKKLALNPPPRAELEREVRTTARRCVVDLSIRLILLGAFSALAAPLVLPPRHRRNFRPWIAAPLIGGGTVAALLLLVGTTFDPGAFRRPDYAGSLQQAPWAISLAQNAVGNTEELGRRLRNVAANLGVLYGRIGNMPSSGPAEGAGYLTVLHISDIHNNPAAVPFVRELAERFQANLVIDTGDLTDFGSPVENQLSAGLTGLTVPYVFVPGNHDSQTTMAAVARRPNATVFDNTPRLVTVAGLRILGMPDPAARRSGASADVNTSSDVVRIEGEALLAAYKSAEQGGEAPDLVCVHNPRIAESLQGVAPVILCGHMHRAYVEEKSATVVCNAGTTGAAGARYLERTEGVDFSAALLHFSRPTTPTERPRLAFIDEIALDGELRRYSLRRHTFDVPVVNAATVSETSPGPPSASLPTP